MKLRNRVEMLQYQASIFGQFLDNLPYGAESGQLIIPYYHYIDSLNEVDHMLDRLVEQIKMEAIR